MPRIGRTVAAAVLGFAVGAGAAAGGVTAYYHLAGGSPTAAGGANPGFATVVDNTNQTLPLGPDTISNMVKRASPAVVKVVAEVPQSGAGSYGSLFNNFFGSIFGGGLQPVQPQYTTDIGSGFFFNSKGDLLTNDHVINGATSISVVVPGYQKPFPATVIGADYDTDLAVLQIHAPKPTPYLPLGNSNTTPVGAWVVAIGNPYNLSHTVTVGVISAKGRPLTIGNRHYRNLLQTSAAINPGNSGGPLLNLAGQVVGINTAVAEQAQGIGFAIPTSTVEQILPQLMTLHHVVRPWIGVYITNDSPTLASEYNLPTAMGAVIVQVVPGSPAAQAGLQSGDVVTAANGKAVTNVNALKAAIDQAGVGHSLTLTINRNGTVLTKTVQVGQEPNGPLPFASSSLP